MLFLCDCRLEWKKLFEPVIQLCKEGYMLTLHTGEDTAFFSSHLILFSSLFFFVSVLSSFHVFFVGFSLPFRSYDITSNFSSVSSLDKKWSVLPINIKNIYSRPNGTRKELGELIKRPDLAETLECIANYKSSAFYNDTNISRSIVDAVRDSGGILTAEDLASYQVRIEEPSQATFNGE